MLILESSLPLLPHAPKEEEEDQIPHYLCQHILVELGEVVGIKKVSHPAHPKQVASGGCEAEPRPLGKVTF